MIQCCQSWTHANYPNSGSNLERFYWSFSTRKKLSRWEEKSLIQDKREFIAVVLHCPGGRCVLSPETLQQR